MSDINTAYGPYSIGSDHWPGISKVAEEIGEVGQVIGKIIGAGGERHHWDGSDLQRRLEDELADAHAAMRFVAKQNGLDEVRIRQRVLAKLALFEAWHAGNAAARIEDFL